MIDVRPFDSLGRFENDWLNARHHFSFAEYYDPARSGFGALLVWNDDTIQPRNGFPMHGHRDMEIVTYVRRGAITHQDHLGNRGRTEAGNVQVMSAGKGILHAEYNLEPETTQIFQIWILPDRQGHPPRWDAREFPKEAAAGRLVPLASGRPVHEGTGALHIHQDAALYGATLAAGQSVTHEIEPGRRVYLVPSRGRITVNGRPVGARDGVAVSEESRIRIEAVEDSEVVLVDVP